MAYETEDHKTQYCFPAINSSCIKEKRSSHEYNIMYMFFSLLSAWTVFLNLLVIISVSHFKKLHTSTNLLILSLAVADLLIGLVVMPIEAIKLIETCWYFGDTYCGLFTIILGLLLSVSISTLVLIAVDRYMAVCHPLQYPHKITTAKTLIRICVCWFFCLSYNISFATSNRYFGTSQKTDICYGECYFTINYSWKLTDMFMFFIFPCTLIITLYVRIFYVAHKQVKVINSLVKFGQLVKEGSVKRKSESKAALTLGIIVTVYLVCFIPYYIFILFAKTTTISSVAITFLVWTVYVNSSLNPVIYALFYSWFKISVKYTLNLKIFQPASSLIDIFTD